MEQTREEIMQEMSDDAGVWNKGIGCMPKGTIVSALIDAPAASLTRPWYATPDTFEAMLATIANECTRICAQRHHKYGPTNIQKHMLNGIIVRLDDKLSRLNQMQETGKIANDESVEDTLIDIANYAMIGLAIKKGWWTKTTCPPSENYDTSESAG